MEIEIDSKKNNPLINRTEVYFTVRHEGSGTPDREIIRAELADKLNVKKENIVINNIDTGFGIQECTGYAKVYSGVGKSKEWETDHILKRNKLVEGGAKKKEDKKSEGEKPKETAGEDKPADEEKSAEEPPKEEEKPSVEEPPKEEQKEEKPPAEEKKE